MIHEVEESLTHTSNPIQSYYNYLHRSLSLGLINLCIYNYCLQNFELDRSQNLFPQTTLLNPHSSYFIQERNINNLNVFRRNLTSMTSLHQFFFSLPILSVEFIVLVLSCYNGKVFCLQCNKIGTKFNLKQIKNYIVINGVEWEYNLFIGTELNPNIIAHFP